MDTTETRDLLFDYFIDKIFIGNQTLTIASWFFDGGTPIDHSDLTQAKQTGEVLNIEFDTSPRSGAQGARVELLPFSGHLLILAEVLAAGRLQEPPIVKLTSSV